MSKIDKLKAKITEKKAKITAKAKKTKTARALLFLFSLAFLAGCATSDPSSRSTTGQYGDTRPTIEIVFEHDTSNNTATITMPITIGDAAIASADSAGSTETTTATPTNTTDIRPTTDVNTTGGKTAGVLESIVGAFSKWLTTDDGKAAVNSATANCPDGSCSDCPDGSCSPSSP